MFPNDIYIGDIVDAAKSFRFVLFGISHFLMSKVSFFFLFSLLMLIKME
jgi:hypothetical protein